MAGTTTYANLSPQQQNAYRNVMQKQQAAAIACMNAEKALQIAVAVYAEETAAGNVGTLIDSEEVPFNSAYLTPYTTMMPATMSQSDIAGMAGGFTALLNAISPYNTNVLSPFVGTENLQ